VPEDVAIYGLGERTASAGLAMPRDGLPTVLWARDVASFNADTNLYGSHPFVMLLRKGKVHAKALFIGKQVCFER
jgi:Galactose mutarotase-like